jgi:hypothetical protein
LKNSTPNKLVSSAEAAEILSKALEKFKDEDGNYDIAKAALEIYDDPKPWHHHKKAIMEAIDTPWAVHHHYHLWEWVGLRSVRAFSPISD